MPYTAVFVLVPVNLMAKVDALVSNAIGMNDQTRKKFVESWDREKRTQASKLTVGWDEYELVIKRKTLDRPGFSIRMIKEESNHRLSICIEFEQINGGRNARMWWTTNGAGSEIYSLVSNYLKTIQR